MARLLAQGLAERADAVLGEVADAAAAFPVHLEEHRAVASVQPPGVVLIEIVLSEPLQQDDELPPIRLQSRLYS